MDVGSSIALEVVTPLEKTMNNFEKRIAYFCSHDCSLFAKLFAFTRHPETQSTIGVPFVLTKQQERVIVEMEKAVNNDDAFDLAVGHERLAGASWLIAVYLVWSVLMKCDKSIHVADRTEDSVFGNHCDSFLFRFDYIMSRLPEWLKPEGYSKESFRSYQAFHNDKTNSMVSASGNTSLHGDRKSVVVFDNFNSCQDAMELYKCAGSCTQSRIVFVEDKKQLSETQSDMELDLPKWGPYSE